VVRPCQARDEPAPAQVLAEQPGVVEAPVRAAAGRGAPRRRAPRRGHRGPARPRARCRSGERRSRGPARRRPCAPGRRSSPKLRSRRPSPMATRRCCQRCSTVGGLATSAGVQPVRSQLQTVSSNRAAPVASCPVRPPMSRTKSSEGASAAPAPARRGPEAGLAPFVHDAVPAPPSGLGRSARCPEQFALRRNPPKSRRPCSAGAIVRLGRVRGPGAIALHPRQPTPAPSTPGVAVERRTCRSSGGAGRARRKRAMARARAPCPA